MEYIIIEIDKRCQGVHMNLLVNSITTENMEKLKSKGFIVETREVKFTEYPYNGYAGRGVDSYYGTIIKWDE